MAAATVTVVLAPRLNEILFTQMLFCVNKESDKPLFFSHFSIRREEDSEYREEVGSMSKSREPLL